MTRFFTLLLGIVLSVSATQAQNVFRIDSLPLQSVILDKGWTWHAGDNPDWAKPGFDDRKWEPIDPTQDIDKLPRLKKAGIGWFRLRLKVDTSLVNSVVGILIHQVIASEIYLDGQRVAGFGTVSHNPKEVEAYDPSGSPKAPSQIAYFTLGKQTEQVLAVRFAVEPGIAYFGNPATPIQCFQIRMNSANRMNYGQAESLGYIEQTAVEYLKAGIFLILALLHLTFYRGYHAQKANLYFGIFCLILAGWYLLEEPTLQYIHSVSVRMYVNSVLRFLLFAIPLPLLAAVYTLFAYSNRQLYRGMIVLGFGLWLLCFFLKDLVLLVGTLYGIIIYAESARVSIWAIKKKKEGAPYILLGTIGFAVFHLLTILEFVFLKTGFVQLVIINLTYQLGVLCAPISIALYLAREFVQTNISLQRNLKEVKQLSAEKEQILTTQNETLELQVSERTAELSQKNQELVIEAALERVRSQSMAMQHSDDLQKVITVVGEQLQGLGFRFDVVNFVVDRADKGWDCYNAVPVNDTILNFTIPYFNHRLFTDAYEGHRQKLDFNTYALTLAEKNEWFNHLFTNTVLKELPAERKQLIIDLPGMAASVVVWPDISLSIINYQGISYTDAQNAFFKRFGAVFGQAYTRFLDLQKAEAQAREAQIEAALERVRSQSMAMQHSGHLREVISVVSAQLQGLGFEYEYVNFVVNRDDQGWDSYNAVFESGDILSFPIPYVDQKLFTQISEAQQEGLDFFICSLTLDEKNEWLAHFFNQAVFKDASEEWKQSYIDLPGLALSIVVWPDISFSIANYQGIPYTETQNAIFKRFGAVFRQAYTRFKDLKKAEEQAKEAQIEAALERVRSQTMAMQHSNHLLKVVHVINEQLQALSFELGMTNFIKSRANAEDGCDSYNAIPGISTITAFYIPYLDHRIFNQIYESLQQGVDFFSYVLTEEEKFAFLNHSYENTVLKDVVPEARKQQVYNFPGWASSVILFSDKKLTLSIIKFQSIPYTDEENAIFKRFGAVFEQAYTRFLDLQKAEEQAREAVRTASLDRVRAQIASMRTTQDLERITPLIWDELTILEVPFFRCGIFIVNQAEQRIHAFLSTPDGRSRTQLNLAIDESENNRQLVQSWQQQRVYRERWSHEQLQQWVASMVEEGQMDSVQEYEVVDEVKEAFSLQFIPFRQGMLYVGSQEPLSEGELELAQSLADTFSVAYARYEDFRQLEEAKARVDLTLTELKATQTQLIQKEKLASLGELTAGIAHEIQNPLNFVNNFSELSMELAKELKEERLKVKKDRDEELENELVDDLIQNQEKINHHGKRASSIVRGMLEHSRVSTGERQPTDLNALADEYLRLAYQGLRAKDSSFSADYELIADRILPFVSVVPQEIGRVVLNLINNAFYAVNQRSKSETADYQPKVTVSTKQKDNQVHISVRDNGGGIPAAIKDKIFQPFFTTKPTGEGTGLGLSLSYDIVTKGHGGTMEVESRKGEGSEFVVWLPL